MSHYPNTLVVGAPRCGTTSIFQYLRQHPDIYLPVRKELHYFTYQRLQENCNGPGDMGVLETLCETKEEYFSHYKQVQNEKIICEISPSYLYYSDISQRLKAELGDIKIIVSLRDPVEKAYSQYMHLVRLNLEELDFYSALIQEKDRANKNWGDIWRYAESSLYADRVSDYIKMFGQENVHVTFLENFIQDPVNAIQRIFQFLEVDTELIPDMRVYNKSGKPRSKIVGQFFARPNPLKNLIKGVVPEKIRVPLRLAILNWNSLEKEEISPEAKALLMAYFREDTAKLEGLLGYPMPWRLK
ncbi:MAG: sulfotransferase [Chloroflexota bacterium]